MRPYLKTTFWHGLVLTGMLLGGCVLIAPFWAVFVGSDIDLGPIRALATAAVICLYGWTGMTGLDIRGPRPRASLLSSLVVALSGVGLVFGLFAIWATGDAGGDAGARWTMAGALLAGTLAVLAVGLLRRSLER